MIRAIQAGSTDGIGLGRPVCEEPDLPAKLISGEEHSSRETLIDINNFYHSSGAAAIQINQMAHGLKPFNSTDKESVERFLSILDAFGRKTQENAQKGIIEAGYALMLENDSQK